MTETEEGIGLVGAGRLGSALGRRLRSGRYPVVAVASRSRVAASTLAAELGCPSFESALEVVSHSSITILTVPDRSILEVASAVGELGPGVLAGRVVLHCAGVLGIEVLSRCTERGADVGVLHPLAPVPDGNPASLDGSWATVEASPGGLGPILTLCEELGITPLPWNGWNRGLYHAAAVLAGVMPVALEGLGEEVALAAGLPMESGPALRQLLVLAAANTKRLGASGGLTGPATRHDSETSLRHLQSLAGVDRRLAEVYRLLLELMSEKQGQSARGGGQLDA